MGQEVREHPLTLDPRLIRRHETVGYTTKSHGNIVYFLYADEVERVKIGTTTNLPGRFSDIACTSPVRLKVILCISGDSLLEKKFHRIVAKSRLHGEWFEFDERVKTLMLNIINNNKYEIIEDMMDIAVDSARGIQQKLSCSPSMSSVYS